MAAHTSEPSAPQPDNPAAFQLPLNKLIRYCALPFVPFLLIGISHASGEKTDWQACVEMQNKASADSGGELDCYRKAAKEMKAAKSLMPLRAHGLEQEWAKSDAALSAYKQSYALIYAYSSQTNDAPTSPNPQNQVLIPTAQDNKNLKFQFSMKHDLYDFDHAAVWFAYTQLSFWQVYDEANSRPFRENNYEPELIYSLRPKEFISDSGLVPNILNIGAVHQSNGQSNPRSRSWNRVYIQPGIEHDFGGDRRLVLLGRWWQRLSESPTSDDNADITDYLGNGDIELRYTHDNLFTLSAITRIRSTQLDMSFTWGVLERLLSTSLGEHNTNIHIQYFSGYGESLIDYNHKHETWGCGLSFPFD